MRDTVSDSCSHRELEQRPLKTYEPLMWYCLIPARTQPKRWVFQKHMYNGRKKSDAFVLHFVPMTHIYDTILEFSNPADPMGIWDSELQKVSEEFRLKRRSFQDEVQSDDVVVSYALEMK